MKKQIILTRHNEKGFFKCALCGKSDVWDRPFWLFDRDDNRPICMSCAESLEPHLLAAAVHANKKEVGPGYDNSDQKALHKDRMTTENFALDLDHKFRFNGSRPEPKDVQPPVIDLGMRHF